MLDACIGTPNQSKSFPLRANLKMWLIHLPTSFSDTPCAGGEGRSPSLKKHLNASRPSEHPPVRGENIKTFRLDYRLQI